MITSLIVSLFSSRWSKDLTLVRPDHLINLERGEGMHGSLLRRHSYAFVTRSYPKFVTKELM